MFLFKVLSALPTCILSVAHACSAAEAGSRCQVPPELVLKVTLSQHGCEGRMRAPERAVSAHKCQVHSPAPDGCDRMVSIDTRVLLIISF